MKKLLIYSLLFFGMAGCYSTAKKEVALNTVRLDRYVDLMSTGQTTHIEDQEMVKAFRIFVWSLNYDMNGIALPADIQSSIAAARTN